ncbi:hypothetical protein I6A84_00180, partial [Frankia sp. CNm7]|nr:hypothetical protein [Frankia nepalensis]
MNGSQAGRRLLRLDEIADWRGSPLVLFVGVTTAGSISHDVFPAWAALLGRAWALRGVDLPPDAPPSAYHRLVEAMASNPLVDGAVVTAHKLRLYRACADRFDSVDPAVELTREVNALATAGPVTAYARDALSLSHVLPGLAGATAHGVAGHGAVGTDHGAGVSGGAGGAPAAGGAGGPPAGG